MIKRIVGYGLAVSVLALGQFQFAYAKDVKAGDTIAKESEKSISVLKKNLSAGFQEFDLSVDKSGMLSYKAVKRSDAGEEVNEKSFQLSSIKDESIKVTAKGGMSFSCKNNQACITFFRNENFKGRRGYNRKIKLRNDSFPVASSDAAAAKQSFQQLIKLYSKDKK